MLAAVPYVKERMRTIVEGAGLIRFLFLDDLAPDDKAVKAIRKAGPDHLRDALARLEALEDWTIDEIRRVLEVFQEDSGLSRTNAWQPIRAAVTGTTVSPPLFESLWLLGRERTLARLRRAVAIAQAHDAPTGDDGGDVTG